MAIGTAYSAATAISSTAGVQSITLNSDAITDIVAACGSGKVTMCLMGYHFDYNGNTVSTTSGTHKCTVGFAEHSTAANRPKITVTHDTGTFSVTAESTGNDDDAQLANISFSGASWADIRGDETTTGNGRNDSLSTSFVGVYNTQFSGRGSTITDCRRSYFVFDFNGSTAPTSGISMTFSTYLDYTGSTGGTYHADISKVILVKSTALEGTTADFGNCFIADTVTTTHDANFFGANF